MGIYENSTSVHLPSRKLTDFHAKPIKTCHVLYTSLKNLKINKNLNLKIKEKIKNKKIEK
jgi:hypothetical protein